MSSTVALVLGALLLAANAFFVGAEFAIISARRSAIEPLAREGDRRAKTVLWAMENVSLMLACAQLGITVCSTSLGVVAEPAIAHLIEAPLHALGVSESLTHPISFVVALAIVVYLHVVLGEMVPKNLAVAGPDRAVLLFGPPLVWVARVVRPVIAALNWIANHALRLVRGRAQGRGRLRVHRAGGPVDRRAVAGRGAPRRRAGAAGRRPGVLGPTAADVMIRTGALVTVGGGSTPEDVERLVARTGFSRFPVVDDAGVPTGYLHLKDVLYADEPARSVPVPPWRVRALAVVGPQDEVEDALAAMQRSGAHLARVDEDGRTVGVVFLEDILEELVGEVRDAMQRGQLS